MSDKKLEKCLENVGKVELHTKICENLHDLYVKKNSDYGDSVSKTFEKYGIVSFLVRMEDKINRVLSLSKKEKQEIQDEKIEDTLMDLANYAILALIELKNQKG